jgi:hypothetical protein
MIVKTSAGKNIVIDINTQQPIISNYLNPNIVIENDNEIIYLIDSSAGALLELNVNNLVVKKLTTFPGFIKKAVYDNGYIICILDDKLSSMYKTSILASILNKEKINPVSGLFIFSIEYKSIRHSITMKNCDITNLIVSESVSLLTENDSKLSDLILWQN